MRSRPAAEAEFTLRLQLSREPVAIAITSGVRGRWFTTRRPVEPGRAAEDRFLDRELVLRAQAGDELAFAELATQIGDRMYATAQHILHDTGRAEDAAQQAMIDIWRYLPRLADPDHFRAWAYRIVMRAAYAEARHRTGWILKSSPLASERRFAPDHASGVADRDQLERGFRRLSIDHRAVLVLKHFAGLSNAEIAEALEIREGTVRSRLHHAIQGLRAALDADARETGSDA